MMLEELDDVDVQWAEDEGGRRVARFMVRVTSRTAWGFSEMVLLRLQKRKWRQGKTRRGSGKPRRASQSF